MAVNFHCLGKEQVKEAEMGKGNRSIKKIIQL